MCCTTQGRWPAPGWWQVPEGPLLFAGVGLAATMPLLWHEHRRTQGWRTPVLVLAASAILFTVSTLTVGRLLGGDEAPEPPGPTDSTEVDPHGHG
jgi:hypothetical protein